MVVSTLKKLSYYYIQQHNLINNITMTKKLTITQLYKQIQEKESLKKRQDFIERARKVHGDKYDYSKVNYVNNCTPITIICPIHDEFPQTPNSHLSGHGCPHCSGNKKLTKEDFIEKAREVHGDKYDYSKVNYVSSKTLVSIICPIHGEFEQTPNNHLRGSGCPHCSGTKKLTKEDFIKKAREIHGDKYDYSKVNYVNNRTKVTIICPIHGEFPQRPSSHLNGKGCPHCGDRKKTTEDFIKDARKVHGDKYDYSKVNYVNNYTPITIICPTHGEFKQTPNDHLNGKSGCPHCAKRIIKDYKLQLLEEYDLLNMSFHQLLELISINALPQEFKKLAYSESGSEKRMGTIQELRDAYSDDTKTEEEIERELTQGIEEEEKIFEEEHKDGESVTTKDEATQDNVDEELPNTNIDNTNKEKLLNEFNNYDKISEKLINYGDKGKFLAQVEIQKFWNYVLSDNENHSTEMIGTLREKRNTTSEWGSFVIDEFFKEYDETNSIKKDREYKFDKAPNLMQKLMVYKMLKNDSYLNLCGTGAGKTNAFLMATKAIGAKRCVIVCPNSVIKSWEEAIETIYPNSGILEYSRMSDLKGMVKCKNTVYIIINYDKFSGGSLSTDDKIDAFIDAVKPQFLCFDEIHLAKARDNNISNRNGRLMHFRQYANDVYGEGFKTIGMTATPLVNNLNEVRSVLELMSGNKFNEIGNRNTLLNIHLAYKNLLLHGFRYIPNYGINVKNTEVSIDGTSLKDKLVNFKNRDLNDIEGTLVNRKMDGIKKDLTPNTILYTSYIDKIVPKIEKKLKEFGITYGRYTGNETRREREDIIKDFSNGKFDILLASSPITTGVNGLQEFCNKMIMMSLPWTNAEYTQLLGRINRQGSKFKEVNIIFPHIDIETPSGETWSWDKTRMDLIINKKTLSDAVVDGVFTFVANINKSKLLRGAIESLRNGEAAKDFSMERERVQVEPRVNQTSREYSESVVNNTHQRANTSTSSTMHRYFTEHKDEWRKYHDARDKVRSTWNEGEDPQDVIAELINEDRIHGTIADLGCGRNELKGKVKKTYSKWLSFDHVANDDTVIEADTTDLSEFVEDESLNAAVYCLSIWGRNKKDYFKEAYRMLKRRGVMYVAEPSEKINQSLFLGDAVISYGFKLKSFKEIGRFTYFKYVKD